MKAWFFISALFLAAPSWAHDGVATVVVEVVSALTDQDGCKVRLKIESVYSSSFTGLEEGSVLENVVARSQFCQLTLPARAGVRLVLQNNQLRIE